MKDTMNLELGQCAPSETTLLVPGVRQADEIWIEMIDGAKATVDVEQFYMSNAPGSRFEAVLEAIERAAGRGVAVRLLVDEMFFTDRGYDEVPLRLAAHGGVQLRTIDFESATGGVQHAKLFVVDGAEAWLGSQNFDWRSLEHITELGVRFAGPALVEPLRAIFEADWALTGGEGAPIPRTHVAGDVEPTPVDFGGVTHQATLVGSPRGWLPDPARFDLPRLIERIEGAQRSVSVQLLSYDVEGHDSGYWDDLDRALRAAASRRVRVRLMVGDWARANQRKLGVLTSLAALPGIDVRVVSVPEASVGPIPFARVIHSKLLVADGERAWIGTNNWSPDYFLKSRNVGLVVDGAPFAQALLRAFDHVWTSEYAFDVAGSSLEQVIATIRHVSQAGRVPIVVFDLDSTLLDPSPRNLRILLEFATDYAQRWPWLARVTAGISADEVGYSLAGTVKDHVRAVGQDPGPVIEALEKYWFERFFTNDYVALDLPNPGAVEFARACHTAGAIVYYMTGRHRAWVPGIDDGETAQFPDGMELGTLEVLCKRGFPIGDGRAVLHLKPRFDIHDHDFKKEGFRLLDDLRGEVVATFENEPGNANQFLEAYPDATHFWLLTEHRPDAPQASPKLVPIEDFRLRPLPPA